MNIRFNNTTTKLPVDRKIETLFLKKMHPLYSEAVEFSQRQHDIDIFLVDETELDDELKRMQEAREFPQEEAGFDLLGVYFSFHPNFNRSVIKVSPEKVMLSALSFKKNDPETLPLNRLYPTLLIAVIVHELAHWVMEVDFSHHHSDVYPWQWLIECRLDDDPDYDFLGRGKHHPGFRSSLHSKWRQMRRFVEESLANAFVLMQKLKPDELDFLKAFIATQPSGYREGVFWSGNMISLCKTAHTWRIFKREGDHHLWNFVFDEGYLPLQKLIDRLRSGESIRAVDFVGDFYKHLANRAGDWQRLYETDRAGWGEHLNGAFGVYDSLTTFGEIHGVKPSRRLRYLKQWAANGSSEAKDKLHKALADLAKARGKYAEALDHQQIRMNNLSILNLNDYRHERYETEINGAIAELDALVN